jgi:genome maintenance exonuclease 1
MNTTFGRQTLSLRAPPFPYKDLEHVDLVTESINGKRHYVLPDGTKYPSVTTVLGSLSKDGILEWRKRVGEAQADKIMKAAADRGTKLHKVCEDYIHNNTDFAKDVMPTTVALFKQVKPWLDEHVEFVYGNEIPLYSHNLRTAGRCDLIAQVDGKPVILDFKTSSKLKKEEWIENYFLQVTAYSIMFEEMYGIPIEVMHIFICGDEGKQHFIKAPLDYMNRTKEVFLNYVP